MQVANIKLKYNQSRHYIDSEDNASLHTNLKSVYVCNNICLAEPHTLPFKMCREEKKTRYKV